ncbi:unnamed protein product [Camellia sinensis]
MPWLWIAVSTTSTEKPNCPKKCGNITIPYPFGLGNPRCSLSKSFLLKCNHSMSPNSSSKLLLGDLQVLNISVEEGTVTVSTYEIWVLRETCHTRTGYLPAYRTSYGLHIRAIHCDWLRTCDTLGYIRDSDASRFGSGCISICYHPVNLTRKGPCSGVGCCQTQIPNGVKTFNMSISALYINYEYSRNFSPCSYIFLARKDWFDFSSRDLVSLTNVHRKPPTVLDWVVGEEICESMDLSASSSSIYPCEPHTNCVNSNNDPRCCCVCKPGYQGNPYLSEGCFEKLLPMPWLWIAASATSTEKPNCPKKCGDITIPYPFGIGNPRCSMNKSFLLKCNHSKSSNSSSKLLLGDLQVLNISVEEGTVTVSTYVPYYCYNMSRIGLDYWSYQVNLTGTPFTFSATENRVIAIGCDTLGCITDIDGTQFVSGCASICDHPVNLTREGPCSGIGCCQTQIPNGLKSIDMSIDAVYNYTYSRHFSPCNYVFLARKDWFDFSSIDLISLTNVDRKPPTVLDWAVGEETCKSMDLSYASSSIYPCGPNTNCADSNNGPGYRCVCKPGYQGNPYLSESQGCKGT